jgi:hypothetical protein
MRNENIDRLLRSAATNVDESSVTMPFGFDTRVIALWRASGGGESNGLTRLVRRVALLAAAIIIIGTAGTLREAIRSREVGESFGNVFAIADAAIQDEFWQ